ncbi:hypothetical protein CK203_034637 [Vitis vinifera]|uniref:Uncharacterized protein n=1 Tax=Vitis vinifera TaxID=29760 RepID=A0A438HW96_VITVI|nr:hypothetical protein CK203_034637 [Vitis vinifera]
MQKLASSRALHLAKDGPQKSDNVVATLQKACTMGTVQWTAGQRSWAQFHGASVMGGLKKGKVIFGSAYTRWKVATCKVTVGNQYAGWLKADPEMCRQHTIRNHLDARHKRHKDGGLMVGQFRAVPGMHIYADNSSVKKSRMCQAQYKFLKTWLRMIFHQGRPLDSLMKCIRLSDQTFCMLIAGNLVGPSLGAEVTSDVTSLSGPVKLADLQRILSNIEPADGAGDPDEGNDFTRFSTVADTFTLHAMFLDCIFQGLSGSCDPFCY